MQYACMLFHDVRKKREFDIGILDEDYVVEADDIGRRESGGWGAFSYARIMYRIVGP